MRFDLPSTPECISQCRFYRRQLQLFHRLLSPCVSCRCFSPLSSFPISLRLWQRTTLVFDFASPLSPPLLTCHHFGKGDSSQHFLLFIPVKVDCATHSKIGTVLLLELLTDFQSNSLRASKGHSRGHFHPDPHLSTAFLAVNNVGIVVFAPKRAHTFCRQLPSVGGHFSTVV
jgi:hypothetical protein